MQHLKALLASLFARLRRFLGWEQPRRSIPFRVWRFFLFIFILLALDVGRYAFWPPVWLLETRNPQSTAFMDLRRDEREDAGKTGELKYTWVDWKKISPNLKLAVTIAEDDGFWDHNGFDLEGMKDAMLRNIARNKLSAGGSTITQQLAKNLYLSPSRNPIRKLKEGILATRLELHLDKQRILELYLNVVEWGDGIFGAEAAARHYFNCSAANLGPRQAAILAAMLPNPRRLQPGGRFVQRQADILLGRMNRR